jgi:4'-phosphopantetheinyl transferase
MSEMINAVGQKVQELHPVVLPVPSAVRELEGLDKKQALSGLARKALQLSAGQLGFAIGALEKDDNGAPLPNNGLYWSLSHCSTCAAAVAAPAPIGIDVERIALYRPELVSEIADEAEWALVGEVTPLWLFSYWTAKEAVLKATGVGLAGLAQCRVIGISEASATVQYMGRVWQVLFYTGMAAHVIAITDQGLPLSWHFESFGVDR